MNLASDVKGHKGNCDIGDGVATHLVFANGFATSRAQSMKSCATGLSVLFFKVTIPTDLNLG